MTTRKKKTCAESGSHSWQHMSTSNLHDRTSIHFVCTRERCGASEAFWMPNPGEESLYALKKPLA